MSDFSPGKEWFVIRAQPRKEELARLNYDNQGLIVYLPLMRAIRSHARRRQEVGALCPRKRQQPPQSSKPVRRERVEPIPNILIDVNVGHNYETGDTVTGVTAGIPLPIFDRNRGTIQQATADLNQSRADAKRLELALSTRLATQYRNYQTAWQYIRAYQDEMLPKAKKANDLLHEGYKARRAAWPDVLVAQRIYLDLQTQYISSLMTYRETDIAIRGLLLTGGLSKPPAPVGGGHIDAVPKPR